jgi:membrane-bound serine protease (ClpP class)
VTKRLLPKWLRALFSLAFIIGSLAPWFGIPGKASADATLAGQKTVEVVDIDDVIDVGMAHRVQRAISDAKANGASAIVFRINTDGGAIDDAVDISDAISGAGVPTIAYVTSRAWSAGAFIALSCDKIYMQQGSSMGAALPITIGPGGESPVDEKFIAAFRSKVEGIAIAHHRDKTIAGAFVDPSIVVPGINHKGQVVSLNPTQAKQHGMADGIVNDLDAALASAGFSGARLVVFAPSWGEGIAQFVSDPRVSGLLLTIGFLGILIELQTQHLIAGVVGFLALALFFGAHIVAGTSNYVILALFGLGVVGLLFELHVLPGHGISGIVGSMLILGSIVLAFGSGVWILGAETTAIALIASIAIFIFLLRWLPESAFGRRLAFAGVQAPSAGFVAAHELTELVGREGVAESMLRPAGVASVGGVRYQVQTEGDFIPPQTKVIVQRVQGATIIVKRAQSPR